MFAIKPPHFKLLELGLRSLPLLMQVTMLTTNHKAHDAFLPLYVVMRHRYSFSARGHCVSFVVVVTCIIKLLLA